MGLREGEENVTRQPILPLMITTTIQSRSCLCPLFIDEESKFIYACYFPLIPICWPWALSHVLLAWNALSTFYLLPYQLSFLARKPILPVSLAGWSASSQDPEPLRLPHPPIVLTMWVVTVCDEFVSTSSSLGALLKQALGLPQPRGPMSKELTDK